MRILIACEFSGVVRDAFRRLGHDAWSCDLPEIPARGEFLDYHLYGDCRLFLKSGWDMMIAHPPCTYLSNAGVRHLHSVASRNGALPKVHGQVRWEAMREGAEFFKELLKAPIKKKAIENPIPHSYALSIIGRKYDQIVSPQMFGDTETKKICFWLEDLPPLMPTKRTKYAIDTIMKYGQNVKDRARLRSITFPGLARAMAYQWGCEYYV